MTLKNIMEISPWKISRKLFWSQREPSHEAVSGASLQTLLHVVQDLNLTGIIFARWNCTIFLLFWVSRWHDEWIGGKIYRKRWFLPLNIGVSCTFFPTIQFCDTKKCLVESCLPNLWGSGWWSRIMCQGVWIGALSHVDLSRNSHIFANKCLFNWTVTDEDSLCKKKQQVLQNSFQESGPNSYHQLSPVNHQF